MRDIRGGPRQVFCAPRGLHDFERPVLQEPGHGQIIRVIEDWQPHLAITDFEPFLPRAAGALTFDVLVRDQKTDPWSKIGVIELDDDVVSDSCDHRLHFSHPRWRDDAA